MICNRKFKNDLLVADLKMIVNCRMVTKILSQGKRSDQIGKF